VFCSKLSRLISEIGINIAFTLVEPFLAPGECECGGKIWHFSQFQNKHSRHKLSVGAETGQFLHA